MNELLNAVAIVAIVAMIGFLAFKLFGAKTKNDTESISKTERQSLGRIVMQIENVFHLGKEGSAVIGTIQDVPLNVNDRLMILDKNGNILETNVSIKEMEKFRKPASDAEPGDTVGLLINVDKQFLQKGLILKKTEV